MLDLGAPSMVILPSDLERRAEGWEGMNDRAPASAL